jgi:hypothetical protein
MSFARTCKAKLVVAISAMLLLPGTGYSQSESPAENLNSVRTEFGLPEKDIGRCSHASGARLNAACKEDSVSTELLALGERGDLIARAREQALEILQVPNACAAWFQESEADAATSRLSTWIADSSRCVITKFDWIAPPSLTFHTEIPYTEQVVRFAPSRLASTKVAWVRHAPLRFAPLRFALLRNAPVRSAPLSCAPLRCASSRFALRRFASLKSRSALGCSRLHWFQTPTPSFSFARCSGFDVVPPCRWAALQHFNDKLALDSPAIIRRTSRIEERFATRQRGRLVSTTSMKASANLSGASFPRPNQCCLETPSLALVKVCLPAGQVSCTQR